MFKDADMEAEFFYEVIQRRCDAALEKMSETDPEYHQIVRRREELSKKLYAILNGEDSRLSEEESSNLSEYIQSYGGLTEAIFCYKRGWLDCLKMLKLLEK